MGYSPDRHLRPRFIRPARSLHLPLLLATGVLAVLALATPVFGAPGSAHDWEGRLARDLGRLERLVDEQKGVDLDIRAVRLEQRATWGKVSRRLSSIYKAGGHAPMRQVLVRGDSVSDVAIAADAIAEVADHDERALQRYQRLIGQQERLEAASRKLDREIEDAAKQVLRDRRELAEARQREQRARERAEQLARKAQSPLVPRVVSAQAVAAAMAGEDPQPAAAPSGYGQRGTASVYATSFAGKPTASGERYEPGAMTAAHPSLPFGTWVMVTGPGGSAMVRINDRGPFVGGRIIDLSSAAAAAVGLPGLGTVTVAVQ